MCRKMSSSWITIKTGADPNGAREPNCDNKSMTFEPAKIPVFRAKQQLLAIFGCRGSDDGCYYI